jgi:hypothetical protein
MAKIVDTKPHNVTVGVIDKNVVTHENLKSVTFADVFGTLHTVFAHVNGPFRTPEDVVSAFESGILHTFDSHEAAIEAWADREGNEEFVNLLKSAAGQTGPTSPSSGGDL